MNHCHILRVQKWQYFNSVARWVFNWLLMLVSLWLSLLHSMCFPILRYASHRCYWSKSFYYSTQERTVKSKLLQFVSGANVLTFWVTAILWDILTFLVTIFFLVCTFAAFQEDGWSTALELSRIFFILFIFVLSILPVTIFASRFFKEPADGFSLLSMVYIFTGASIKINQFLLISNLLISRNGMLFHCIYYVTRTIRPAGYSKDFNLDIYDIPSFCFGNYIF